MSPASAAYYEFELPEDFDEWLAEKRKENPNFARCTLAPMAAMPGHPSEQKRPVAQKLPTGPETLLSRMCPNESRAASDRRPPFSWCERAVVS